MWSSLFHINVLCPSLDLIARKISANDQKYRSADLQFADYKEKTKQFVNPEFFRYLFRPACVTVEVTLKVGKASRHLKPGGFFCFVRKHSRDNLTVIYR